MVRHEVADTDRPHFPVGEQGFERLVGGDGGLEAGGEWAGAGSAGRGCRSLSFRSPSRTRGASGHTRSRSPRPSSPRTPRRGRRRTRRRPSPTCSSLPYAAAVSMCRYPRRRAVSTAAALSSGGLWNTPSPIVGRVTPLLRVRSIIVASSSRWGVDERRRVPLMRRYPRRKTFLATVIRLRSRGSSPGPSQMSPKRMSSVSSTSFGAKRRLRVAQQWVRTSRVLSGRGRRSRVTRQR